MSGESIIQKESGFRLREHAGLLLILTGVLLLLSLIFYNPDPDAGLNITGTFGRYSASALFYLFGAVSHIVGPFLILVGIEEMRKGIADPVARLLSLILMLFSGSVLLYMSGYREDAGITGNYLGIALSYLFGVTGSVIISAVIMISALLFASSRSIGEFLSGTWQMYSRLIDRTGRWGIRAGKNRQAGLEGGEFESPQKEGAVEAMRTGKIFTVLSEDLPWIEKKMEADSSEAALPSEMRSPEAPPVKNELAEGNPFTERSAPDGISDMVNLHNRLKERRGEIRSYADVEPAPKLDSERGALFRGVFTSDGKKFLFDRGERIPDKREERVSEGAPESSGAGMTGHDEAYGPVDGSGESYPLSSEETNQFDITHSASFSEIPEHGDGISFDREAADPYAIGMDVDDDSVFEDVKFDPSPVMRESLLVEYDLPPVVRRSGRYFIPPEILSLSQRSVPEDVHRELEETRDILERVMRDYGVLARVVHIQRGPIITMYEIRPEPGVKVSKIIGIYDELKMNLEAASLRIIAPIPGKPTIGIEIPNRRSETVRIGDIIRLDSNFFSPARELPIILGKDITGENAYIDLTKLPHLLIAGATGAGKSVYMNVIISSLLYARSPEEVRFIMIDPKMVELKLFEGIPHLLMPVITDVRKAGKALNWTIQEMERRYTVLSGLKCRDIRSYNERAKKSGSKEMPYIVVLIDELSDLMMVSGKEVEDSIIRLTQKARAVGIHVIMATQRPSVDVITALIKANCPARISFQVAQKTDARTILDMNGAETLMGRGDMLYKSPTASGLRRMQAPLITEMEIESIVEETTRFGEPAYVELPEEDFEEEGAGSGGEIDSALIQDAWRIILESGKTSTSYIQRRLKIGYNRAANLVEILEDRGYLGPPIGNKPREILKRS